MQKNTILFVTLALFVGFVGGFFLANSINRTAMKSGGSLPASSNLNSKQTSEESDDLTEDEIKAKIAEADKNPSNFSFQKELGIALYSYAAMKNNSNLLPEAVRILDRANSLNARDFDVLATLGNAHFDIGFAKKDTSEFQKAREIYSKALEVKPSDADVQTDVGISYVVQEPPAYDKGAAQLQKVLDANPKNKRAVLYLVRALIGQDKVPDAEKALANLKSIDPNNQSIPELTSLISDAQTGSKK